MPQQQIIYILSPIYNDWESYSILAQRIELLQQNYTEYTFKFIAVNDGSDEDIPKFNYSLPYIQLNLKINVGHQRAIAVGLQYIHNEIKEFDYVIVMDSDGEDQPEDIPKLIEKAAGAKNKKIVFAQRKRRQESLLFKTGYYIYKALFTFLTGQTINFGNFSIIPKGLLGKIVHQSNIWNHYSGSIIQAKTPYTKILLDRGKRYRGVSKMKFGNLIIHGLSSIAVYFDVLSLKILKYSAYAIIVCFFTVLYIVYEKLFTDSAIPGWASSLTLIIMGIILQLFSVTLIVLLLQLSSRKHINAPNSKIYAEFIESIQEG